MESLCCEYAINQISDQARTLVCLFPRRLPRVFRAHARPCPSALLRVRVRVLAQASQPHWRPLVHSTLPMALSRTSARTIALFILTKREVDRGAARRPPQAKDRARLPFCRAHP
eukprot:1663332-Pleurochrysis_carterae.AAC.1